MNRKLILLPLFCLSLTIIFLSYPKSTSAEIATVRDWIGLFSNANESSAERCTPSDTATTCMAKTVNGDSWVYTSSCTQTPGPIPSLANRNGCNFTLPSDAGNYQLRMYANGIYYAPGNADLGTTGYDEALLATSRTITVGPLGSGTTPTAATGKIYNVTGDLTINNNITVNVTGVIFVEGNLNITVNLENDNKNTGLVFVVKGDVLIDKLVTQIDAVIISSGTIYTAAGPSTGTIDCAGNSENVDLPPVSDVLRINGSLIALDPEEPIVFCRTLDDTTKPAEIVESQPKYLVILKNLYSETIQKWSELADAPVFPE